SGVQGADVVGFEHVAKSDEDKLKVDAALETLSAPLKIFVLPEDAGCEQTVADVELEQAGDHSEFHASYAMTCSAPDKINIISFAFFEAFPNSAELEVQVVSEKGQMAHEVERDKPDLALNVK
ncbi:MAG: ZrgA family zinc uptake protein, partial [Hyphomicrobiales bacterium]